MNNQNKKHFYPTICPNCGNWLTIKSYSSHFEELECDNCNTLINQYSDFYILCHVLDYEIFNDNRYRNRIIEARESVLRLNSGWSPDFLAILSGFVLGILTNTSYDLLKYWMKARRKKYTEKYQHSNLNYDETSEIIIEFLIDNIEKIEAIKIDKKLIQFDLRKEITDLERSKENNND